MSEARNILWKSFVSAALRGHLEPRYGTFHKSIEKAQEKTPLMYAAEQKDLNTMMALMNEVSKRDMGQDETHLHNQAKHTHTTEPSVNMGQDETQQSHLGVYINQREHTSGMTALMYAANKKNNVDVIRSLIKGGASIDTKDNDGRTALIHAAIKNSAANMFLLLSSGADANLQDNSGKTALIHMIDNSDDKNKSWYSCIEDMCAKASSETCRHGLEYAVQIEDAERALKVVQALDLYANKPDLYTNIDHVLELAKKIHGDESSIVEMLQEKLSKHPPGYNKVVKPTV